MKNILHSIILLLIGALLTSCEEEITLNLNHKTPEIVIEAKITTSSENSFVKITQTADYYDENNFSPIEGALVELSDSEGNKEILKEQQSGMYSAENINGKTNIEYYLKIDADNRSFSSTSQMPEPVHFDSISVKQINEKNDNDSYHDIYIFFHWNEGYEYYLQVIEYINGEKMNTYLYNDIANGMAENKKLKDEDRILKEGDIISIELRCITSEVYTYLSDLHSSSGMEVPSNPRNNINGTPLGYFSAYTNETQKLVYNRIWE
ncbi:DUF4249 family protein [Aureibacter tunicatorum]|uniref:DUF4249 domain-containing protein n=1 Tax=Aureibacter tunicatorum TaxID=866807 RepID=A0AAE4BPE9_9BACT|nr:DUF4249 family protein [Aureibacter tunicatorum]MDR6237909.1 hypothetical protein [Aureibacter tunicatorum]BDD02942.1 hypothetical protein AUTU_04250 [Aureibacter tunicatorum]